MKRVSNYLLINVLLMLVGVVLTFFHQVPDMLRWIAIVIGILFLLPSLSYLMVVALRKSELRTQSDMLGILPAVGGMCFGLIMIIKPHLFENVIILLLGVFMVVLGLYHIIFLILSWRTLGVKAWHLLAPVTILAFGASVLLMDWIRNYPATVALFTGVSLLLFNGSSLGEYMAERRLRKQVTESSGETAPAETEDEGPHDIVIG